MALDRGRCHCRLMNLEENLKSKATGPLGDRNQNAEGEGYPGQRGHLHPGPGLRQPLQQHFPVERIEAWAQDTLKGGAKKPELAKPGAHLVDSVCT